MNNDGSISGPKINGIKTTTHLKIDKNSENMQNLPLYLRCSQHHKEQADKILSRHTVYLHSPCPILCFQFWFLWGLRIFFFFLSLLHPRLVSQEPLLLMLDWLHKDLGKGVTTVHPKDDIINSSNRLYIQHSEVKINIDGTQ